MIIRPQPGPQEDMLACSADVLFYGGAAGGGKTWSLLVDPLRAIHLDGFRGAIFRRESVQITNDGGLWDESEKVYRLLGAESVQSPQYRWRFADADSSIAFLHINQEKDVEKYQGAQFAFLGFDELTHFTKKQFLYMLSRLRSTCGVKPWVRATMNPDADSWVLEFIEPFLDGEGYPDPEKCGKLRWFVIEDGGVKWVDEVTEDAKSFTFIPASIYDNKILLKADPAYLANLKAQDNVTRARLLGGNWYATHADGMFKDHQIEVVDDAPHGLQWVRYWDLANTEPNEKNKDPDWTAGALCAMTWEEVVDPETRESINIPTLWVADMRHAQLSGDKKRKMMTDTARADGRDVEIIIEQEGGSSGSEVGEQYVRQVFASYRCILDRPTGSKVQRATAWLPAAESGRVKFVAGPWVNGALQEIQTFPKKKKDQVDAISGAYAHLIQYGPPRKSSSIHTSRGYTPL
jgi:phage terminase large subunit-like protein